MKHIEVSVVARGVCAVVPAGFVPLRRDQTSDAANRPAGS